MLFFAFSLKEFVFIIRVEDLGGGKLVLLMKITSCKNKWTVNASRKSLHTCFFILAGCLSWMRAVEYESFFSVFRSVLPLTRVVSSAKPPWEK